MKSQTPNFAAGGLIGLGLALAGPLQAAPNATVEGVRDSALRVEIEVAVGEARAPVRGAADARRRANDAAKDAVALLRSEGYYDGVAEPAVVAAPSPRPVIRVTAGPRYRLTAGVIEWVGVPPDVPARAEALAALHLAAGGPGRAADILAAEGRVVARLQKLGYADAAIEPRQVVVDHAANTVGPTLRIASGAVVRLGDIRAGRRERTRTRWLATLAPWKRGERYDPALLAKLEKRLFDTGAYQSVSVALAPTTGPAAMATPDGPRPVIVTLVDRPPRSLELGAAYSTTEGSGLDAKWTLYDRLGRADSLILTARLYDIQQKLDLEQDLPNWLGSDQTLKIGGGFLGDRTPAYDDLGGGVRLNVTRRFDRSSSITLGGAFDFVSTQEKTEVNLEATPVGESLDLYITTLKAAFVLDRSNSILNPTRGWRLEAETDPTWVAGDRDLVYLKADAQLSGYLPLGDGWPVLAARVKLGSILGGSIPGVPADRRFFAGGGGSVRGFGYQEVGPQLSDGTPVGGLSLTEGSIELRQALTKHWGLVAFADAGGIGETSAPAFDDLGIGVGAGVRYDLGFGPLRLDLATPVNPRPGAARVQVYISIGQAF